MRTPPPKALQSFYSPASQESCVVGWAKRKNNCPVATQTSMAEQGFESVSLGLPAPGWEVPGGCEGGEV